MLTIGSIMNAVILLVSNLISAHFVAPLNLGIIQTVMLIPTYFAFIHFGVFNGLGRNLPLYLGMDDQVKAQKTVDNSWAVAKIVGWISLGISLGFLGLYFFNGYPRLYLWGMVAVTLTICTEPLFTHLDGVFRSCRHFEKLGKILLWQNLVGLAFSFLPVFWGALGVIAFRAIQGVIRVVLRLGSVPMVPKGPASFKEATYLVRVGMPLLLSGTIYSYLGVADRSLVASLMTAEDVGKLSLASLGVIAIQTLPVTLGSLFYPRIVAVFGRSGTSRSLRRYFWLSLLTSAAVVIPTSIGGYLFVGPFTRAFLPKYVGGIHAAEISSLGCISFVYFGVTGIIAALRRNTFFIVCMLVIFGMVWILGAYLIKIGMGIDGAAWARAIGNGVLCVIILGYAYYLTSQDIRPETAPVSNDETDFQPLIGD